MPILVLGEPGGSRLQAASISAGLIGDLVWDAVASKASADIGFETDFVQGQLIIDLSEADGFLRNVLPKDGIQAKLDFGLSWSAEHGFTFRGAVGLTATFPVGLSFAGLEIPTVRFALTADGSELRADLSAGVGLSIGSFAVLVDGVGLSALATFPSSGGNLGVFDLRFAFLPPGSIGLSVHGGGLAGGGFIHSDQASGRYSGTLQLQLRQIGITGLGLLDSRVAGRPRRIRPAGGPARHVPVPGDRARVRTHRAGRPARAEPAGRR